MATKAPRHKAKLFDNRLAFRGSGFKGYTCWKLLTIVIKIRLWGIKVRSLFESNHAKESMIFSSPGSLTVGSLPNNQFNSSSKPMPLERAEQISS